MMPAQDYYKTARENEPVFRNILRDLKNKREERPMGYIVPADLDTESSLDDIFEKYSEGVRYGRFTICDFTRPNKDSATIKFENVATFSGGGAGLKYQVKKDSSTEYKKEIFRFMR